MQTEVQKPMLAVILEMEAKESILSNGLIQWEYLDKRFRVNYKDRLNEQIFLEQISQSFNPMRE